MSLNVTFSDPAVGEGVGLLALVDPFHCDGLRLPLGADEEMSLSPVIGVTEVCAQVHHLGKEIRKTTAN